MAGQSTCSSPNSADIVTEWERDSALRLTKLIKPDASCLFYEYDARGRLQRTKRRDDCVIGNAGDKQEFVYDTEGLLLETQTYDASNVLTAKQAFSYADSRRLERMINPVDPSKWTGLSYDGRGLLTQIDEADTVSVTKFDRTGVPGQEGRVTAVSKGTTTVFDTWSMLYNWLGATVQLTEPETKATLTEHDDFGRLTMLTNPDQTFPNLYVYNEGSQQVTRVEAFGGGTSQRTHNSIFDGLDRRTSTNFHGNWKAAAPAEVMLIHDAPPLSAPCPTGFSCTRTAGRLAYSKSKLRCKNNFGLDDTVYRETHYRYDDAGRLIGERIMDAGVSPFQQSYAWNKNGDLLQTTIGTGSVIGYTYGSASNNSDADLVTAVWRTSSATPIVDNVTWFPYGPLKSYNQKSTHGGTPLRTRYTRNLAYRVTGTYYEKQTGGTVLQQMVRSEDAMGRTTARDFNAITGGPTDSYYLYDSQGRLLCETTTMVTSCPTSGTNLKNNQSLGYSPASDWKRILRPIPGSTGLTHDFNSPGASYGTNHRITNIDQSDGTPTYGKTNYTYNAYGERTSDDNVYVKAAHDQRTFSYDDRRNLTGVVGEYWYPSSWRAYDWQASYDLHNRRVWKSMYLPSWGVFSSLGFYYDGIGRLAGSFDGTIATEFIWLGHVPVAFVQTDTLWGDIIGTYIFSDETARPVSTWSWYWWGPADSVLNWSISPSAWGMDTRLSANIFQPLGLGGGYRDDEIAALLDDHVTVHRPGLILMGSRSYDPFSGHYLQINGPPYHGYQFSGENPVSDGPIARECPPPGCPFPEPIGESGGRGGCGIVCKKTCESDWTDWLVDGLAFCNCELCSTPPSGPPTDGDGNPLPRPPQQPETDYCFPWFETCPDPVGWPSPPDKDHDKRKQCYNQCDSKARAERKLCEKIIPPTRWYQRLLCFNQATDNHQQCYLDCQSKWPERWFF